jgi:hypothetical protein
VSRKRPRLATRSVSFDRYVGLHHFMVKSPAWKTMQAEAKALYIDVAERYNGVNNSEISYSVREAVAIGLSPATASRMFKVLIERGFLRVAQEASFQAKAFHLARLWTLTAWAAGGERASKDFMTWVPKPNPGFTDGTARFQQRNRGSPNETKLPPTVSAMKPENLGSAPQRFPQCNISIEPLPATAAAVTGAPLRTEFSQKPAADRSPLASLSNGDLRERVARHLAGSKRGALARMSKELGIPRASLGLWIKGTKPLAPDRQQQILRWLKRDA